MEGKRQDHHNDEEKEKSTSKLGPIPLELEVEILTRLPVKSLFRFRCVSEIWSSIIRSQRFIDYFFAMSSQRSRFIVALWSGRYGKRGENNVFLFSASHERNESSSSSCLVDNLDMTIPKFRSSSSPWFCASSVHGFLGVYVKDRFFICNPSTNQVIKLNHKNKFLVYDPIDDEHKVISVKGHNNVGDHYLKVYTLRGRGGESGRRIKDATIPSSRPLPVGIFINGFLYYGARTQTDGAVIVCFDVRSEKLSFIKAPKDVLYEGDESVLIEYKGKLASIVRHPYRLWVLEDTEKHEWSKQTFVVPLSVWDSVNDALRFSGTNKAGEIIMAQTRLLSDGPFYVFYYNVDTKNVRRVEIQGTQEIRERYGLRSGRGSGVFHVCIIPQHVDSIKSCFQYSKC